VPVEAIELQLIELFHCTPSQLDEEDGWRCLTYLELRHWRDAALAYKDKDRRKSIPREDRMRIARLLHGERDALKKEVGTAEQFKEFLKEANKGG